MTAIEAEEWRPRISSTSAFALSGVYCVLAFRTFVDRRSFNAGNERTIFIVSRLTRTTRFSRSMIYRG